MTMVIEIKNFFYKEAEKCQIISKIAYMLARNLLCEICANLIDFLKNFIFSEKFLTSCKQSPKDFTRNRILPFHHIIFFLINLIKGSYQDELDGFFKALDHSESFIRKVTKSAFCKARKKLKSNAFIQLNLEAINYFYRHFNPKKWFGFTLLAVDGSTIKVPKTAEVEKHFGLWGVNGQNPCPLGRISQLGLDTLDLRLRLIRIELKNGETEILLTSLVDTEAYPAEIFYDLYHQRWPVEEDYKLMKCRIEIENFTGKSVLSVYQDFHARVFSKNITAMLAFPARLSIEQENDKRYPYQINFTQAISKMKDTIVLLFDRPLDTAKTLISALHNLFLKTVEPVRPNRKFPRKHKIQKMCFYPSFKPVR
ncbi:MAG: hypothetical protein AB1547_11640 [Thermodesulfobacteriota bacterium]